MDLVKLKELIKIIDNSSVTKFSYRDSEVEISVGKPEHQNEVGTGVSAGSMAYPVATVSGTEGVSGEAESEDYDSQFITSSMVGTFYSAQDLETPAFVKTGDKVKKGQVVCMLEAMKLMTELRSEYDCKIIEVLVENGQKVEYGQRLFRIKKL